MRYNQIGLVVFILLLVSCAPGANSFLKEDANEEPTIIASTTTTEQRKELSLSQLVTLSGDFAHHLIDELRPYCIEEYGESYCYPVVHKVGFMSECEFRPYVENRWDWTHGFRLPNGPVWLVYFADPYGEFTGYAQLSTGKWNIDQSAMDLIPCWETHGYWPIFPPGSHFVPYETPSVSEGR